MVRRRQHVVYLGLGSNRGSREQNILEALRRLDATSRYRVTKISSLYLTSPLGPPQRDFVNAAAQVRTSATPRRLLADIQKVEDAMGRRRTRKRWGPRIIDLDILFYDRDIVVSPGLQIPHAEIHNRLFVLEPLCELNPELIHPVFDTTVGELRALLLLTRPKQKVTISN